MEEQKVGYKSIVKQKEFMKLVIADVINRFGDSIDAIAFTWMVYLVTQSAAWSAIIFGINQIPTIFLQPFAGAAIEGKNKKIIMIIMDIIRGICVGFIATTLMLGILNQWMLLIVTIIISSAEAFRRPASTAILPKLLDKSYYEYGLSLSSSICSMIGLLGMASAGFIIAKLSISAAIYIDMATFFLSAIIIITLKVNHEKKEKAQLAVKEYMEVLKGGFQYLKENSVLRYFVILAVFLNAVLVPYNSLLAPMIKEVLHMGGGMLSILSISLTVGMILGAVFYPMISKKLGGYGIAILGGYSVSVFYISFVLIGKFITSSLLTYFILAMIAVGEGIAISLFNSFVSIEFVKNTKEDYLARTSAVLGAASVSATPVISFAVSFLARFVSTVVLFMIAGLLNILICIVLYNKKKLSAIIIEEPKGVQNEEVIGDSTTC